MKIKKYIHIATATLLALTLLTDTQAKSPDGKCRALALRGGGTKGAYEVGVLKGLVQQENPLEY